MFTNLFYCDSAVLYYLEPLSFTLYFKYSLVVWGQLFSLEFCMLKMNDLVKLTSTPKSTILYYIKENLLPEPYKDKPNFHLYDEKCVRLIELIKYLQSHFNASISQIKALFAQADFDLDNPYQSLIRFMPLIMGAENEVCEPEQLCREFNLTETQLNEYVSQGVLTPRDGIFTSTEYMMLSIYARSNEPEKALIQRYIDTAKQLAELEMALVPSMELANEDQEVRLKHGFDILLILKPYIFNMQTLRAYQKT